MLVTILAALAFIAVMTVVVTAYTLEVMHMPVLTDEEWELRYPFTRVER